MYRAGFIGAGNMAGAILHGIVSQKVLPAGDISVYDVFPGKAESFEAIGCHAVSTLGELLNASDVLFWCVKPQNIGELAESLKAEGGVGERLNISIVTGIAADFYFEHFGPIHLIQVMPNTPLLLGAGCTAVANGFHTTPEEFDFCRRVFDAAGITGIVPPEKLPEMVGINGSTPAFFYRMAKVISDHMVERGFDRETVEKMVAGTMLGSARMLLESGDSAQELIRKVSSPGGTTLAGLARLDETGFDDSLCECLDAAIARSYELGKK